MSKFDWIRASREEWFTDSQPSDIGGPIRIGCLQRIASAMELIASEMLAQRHEREARKSAALEPLREQLRKRLIAVFPKNTLASRRVRLNVEWQMEAAPDAAVFVKVCENGGVETLLDLAARGRGVGKKTIAQARAEAAEGAEP